MTHDPTKTLGIISQDEHRGFWHMDVFYNAADMDALDFANTGSAPDDYATGSFNDMLSLADQAFPSARVFIERATEEDDQDYQELWPDWAQDAWSEAEMEPLRYKDLAPGMFVFPDGGFDCMNGGVPHLVCRDDYGLYFVICSGPGGRHYLDGQRDYENGTDTLIGFSKMKEQLR